MILVTTTQTPFGVFCVKKVLSIIRKAPEGAFYLEISGFIVRYPCERKCRHRILQTLELVSNHKLIIPQIMTNLQALWYNICVIKNKKTLWGMFSKKIREGSANHQGYVKCPSCDKTFHWTETDCGHFIENTERSKQYGGNALWFDKRNFAPQCQTCNRFATAEAKQKWTAKFIQENGMDLYKELWKLKTIAKKWTPEEIRQIIEEL